MPISAENTPITTPVIPLNKFAFMLVAESNATCVSAIAKQLYAKLHPFKLWSNMSFDSFAGGVKAMAKSWIMRNCQEKPEQMAKILTNEYKINSQYFSLQLKWKI